MENKVKDQLHTERYSIYESDCMLVMPTLEDKSIDLSVYSPPFAGLYNYSSSEHDMSNCESKEQFLEQYEYLVQELQKMVELLPFIVLMFLIILVDCGIFQMK